MTLPNSDTLVLRYEQRVARFDSKGVIPGIDVRKCAVHAPTSERMRIHFGSLTNFCLTDAPGPNTGVSNKETLLGRIAFVLSERLILRRIFECGERNLQSAVVSQVFAGRKWPVAVQIWQNLYVIQ